MACAEPAFSQQRWERTYGGPGDDKGYSVQQTLDGGYIVAGQTSSFGNGYQVYLIKTNASGDTLWTRTYGGMIGYSVQQTSDGGYIVTGLTYSPGYSDQVYLIKTDASGDTLWTKIYGGERSDGGESIQQTSDGGYVVVGYSSSFGNGFQVYLIKTNASGDTLWTKTYGGTGSDYGYSVHQTSDGGYIVAGETSSFGYSGQVYLIKINALGDTLWTRNYGGKGHDRGYSVHQTSDSGYIVTGQTAFSLVNPYTVYLIKTGVSGYPHWIRTYGGTNFSYGYSVRQTMDGGYIVAGQSGSFGNSSQVYLIKINALGDILWTGTYGRAFTDEGRSVWQTTDGGYIVAGWTYSLGDSSQGYLIKTDENGSSGVGEDRQGDGETRGQGERLRATPNPFTSFATLPGHEAERFSLYDVSGRKVGTYRGDRIGVGLASGVYFLKPEGINVKPIRIVKLR